MDVGEENEMNGERDAEIATGPTHREWVWRAEEDDETEGVVNENGSRVNTQCRGF